MIIHRISLLEFGIEIPIYLVVDVSWKCVVLRHFCARNAFCVGFVLKAVSFNTFSP